MSNDSTALGFLTPTSPPPAYDDALTDQLTATVVGITGLDVDLVRPRWLPVPRIQPTRGTNWCAVGVIGTSADTNTSVIHDGQADGGLGATTEFRGEEFTIAASFYGPNASGYAARLRDGFSVSQNRDAIRAKGLVFVETQRITTVPDLTNQEWINRVDLVFVLRRFAARTYAIRNILTLQGTVVADSGGIDGPRDVLSDLSTDP